MGHGDEPDNDINDSCWEYEHQEMLADWRAAHGYPPDRHPSIDEWVKWRQTPRAKAEAIDEVEF